MNNWHKYIYKKRSTNQFYGKIIINGEVYFTPFYDNIDLVKNTIIEIMKKNTNEV